MIKVCAVSLQEDLTEFTRFLWQNEIPHRVLETEESQELWVAHTVNAQQIYHLFERWREGQDLSQLEVTYHPVDAEEQTNPSKQCWVSMVLIGVSIMFTLMSGFGANFDLLSLLTITDIQQRGDSYFTTGLAHTLSSFELWRFFTPMFLHFSLPHIIFNLLWIWVVGRRMEAGQGRAAFLMLVLFAALISNLAQYWVSGPLFGGMSGVVFALLGYAWLWDKTHIYKVFSLPPALMGFMLFWLVLGYTGALEGLGFGAIANTAHLVGMLAGLAFVPLMNLYIRLREGRNG